MLIKFSVSNLVVKQEGWVVYQGPGDILRAVQAFIGQLFGAKIDGPLERGELGILHQGGLGGVW